MNTIEKAQKVASDFKSCFSTIKNITNIKCNLFANRFEVSFLIDGWIEHFNIEISEINKMSYNDVLAITNNYKQQL